MLITIAAIDRNFVIGDSSTNKMPWHNTEELQYFKKTTSGSMILMGRKTAESVGQLPGRINLLLTRNPENKIKGFYPFTIEQVLELSKKELVFVAGGKEVYLELIPYCSKIYLSRLPIEAAGDVYFPKELLCDFKLINQKSFNTFELEKWVKIYT